MNPFKVLGAFIISIILILVFGALLGMALHGLSGEQEKENFLKDELMQLYSWNYVETSNPTKKIRLQAALKRISKQYGCKPTAMPDLRLRCKQTIPVEDRDIIIRLIAMLEIK
jgi:hypothetical protein